MDSLRQQFLWISTFAFGLSAMLGVGNFAAQMIYPDKPFRLVVPRPPGSLVDTVARPPAQELTEALEISVEVDNSAGAAGNTATERVAKAAPDG